MRGNVRRDTVCKRTFCGVAVAIAVVISAVRFPPPVAADTPAFSCRDVQLLVSLAAGAHETAVVHGSLCVAADSHTVQVLTAGATYDSTYWNPQYQPGTYSYTRFMTAHGLATFNYDPLGTGRSSHPLSASLTVQSSAWVLSQIVRAMRTGAAGHGFERVIAVGHSVGSIVTLQEEASYRDVDATVLTGLLHTPHTLHVSQVAASLVVPAALDPAFASESLDPGYLTTLPGTRGADFYYTAAADPAMIAYDEATKQPFVATMAGTVLVQLYGTRFLDYLSRSITAPVLLVVGDHDSLFCGGLDGGNCQSPASVLAEERSHYPNAASLSALVARDAGHDVNFHPSAPATYLAIEQWLA